MNARAAELANLGAAWDVAGRHDDLDARVAMLLKIDTFTTYRDLHELSGWALELAGDPAVDGHPRRAGVEGAAAGRPGGGASWTWPCSWPRPPSTMSPPRPEPSRRGPRSPCSGAIPWAPARTSWRRPRRTAGARHAGPRARGPRCGLRR